MLDYFLINHLIHQHVILSCGDGGEELEGEADAELVGGDGFEQAVVVAFAPAEAVACGIEGDAWNEGEGYVGEVDGGGVGLEYAVGSWGERLCSAVGVDGHLGGGDDFGQEDGFALTVEGVDELVGAGLVGQGVIEQQGVSLNDLGVGEQTLLQVTGVCLQLLGRVAADDGLYVGAEGALGFTHGLFLEVKGVIGVKGVKDNTIDYTYVSSSSEALQASRARSPSKLEER